MIIHCVRIVEHELFAVDKSAEYQNIGYRKSLTCSFVELSTVRSRSREDAAIAPIGCKQTFNKIVYADRIDYYIELLSAV